MIMEDSFTVFTIVYFIIALCIVFPSKEFVGAGVTIENIFSSFLGSEDLHFCQYHIKRTVTVLVHSLLPFGFYVGCAWTQPDAFLPWNIEGISLLLFLEIVIIIPVAAAMLVIYWAMHGWKNHPIARALAAHAEQSHHPWYTVASSVNIEFRRVDKFCSVVGARRTYVTDSWVLKCGAYVVRVAHRRDIHLSLAATEEFDLHHESFSGVQFLSIRVESVNPLVAPFTIRLNSLEYKDLKAKLGKPIRNARNIIIHQTLSDRFLVPFKDQVDQNQPYLLPENVTLENCIGCMQVLSNVKLQKLCQDEPGQATCVQCYCRPMWCLSCMGKWFASRQDQTRPDTWMGCKSPCPTCRATFCMLDVSLVMGRGE